ncbi:GTPase obg [Syntrophobotulus glycolicus DSM 8271]|uniref:GTPase Obg n=1 Tax=Syntrophobotulus glycolicus (strain DSM 8271 / FlGlyR) TaxID=645991 RepID=F0SVH0_SYNGF|nr:GTPase ObgE [Syntrophobotulus glycolicus]ADY56743.1 GTPase obg [Syntrophobotulus glycolicus DSM 8271]
MFYDQAKIFVKAGDGGSGIVSFRREKYVPMGGPDGGDGGRGGSIIFQADEGLRTLVDFRYRRHYKGDRGQHGQGKNMHGRGAENFTLRVPVGTVVKDEESGEILADLTKHGQSEIVAKGGRGGRGNARFMSNTNKAPTIAEKGEPGQEKCLILELKLLADVGLVGFPNVGKSTLISRVSSAKPKIADYHFTTLVPNLGMVNIDETGFVMADIPGLIEGAHSGAGLGHEFLRHVERTRVLVHVLDISGSEDRDPVEDFVKINKELNLYSQTLATRPMLVAANKTDLSGAEGNLAKLRETIGGSYEIFPISAVTGEGVEKLLHRIAEILPGAVPLEFTAALDEHRIVRPEENQRFSVERDQNGIFIVKGKEVEKHAAMSYLDTEDGLRRFQKILKTMGIDDALIKKGIKEKDKVLIGHLELEWSEGI